MPCKPGAKVERKWRLLANHPTKPSASQSRRKGVQRVKYRLNTKAFSLKREGCPGSSERQGRVSEAKRIPWFNLTWSSVSHTTLGNWESESRFQLRFRACRLRVTCNPGSAIDAIPSVGIEVAKSAARRATAAGSL
eukprot:1487343-Pleurochrysis_carterae.AAC.2